MGVPGFFRWLVSNYPRVCARAVDEYFQGYTLSDIDWKLPNPNGEEFDNLYVDMNGLIHPCFHPEHYKPPESLEEIFRNILSYLEHLISIVRPRKLLYLAMDGVPPLAKLNLQRVRRFQTARDYEHSELVENCIRKAWGFQEKMGTSVSQWEKLKDSNVITPGTEFMAILSTRVKSWIINQINNKLSHLTVIFSDSSVAGEGEHKIAYFIRQQRQQPTYNPQTRHCIYGSDADLIFLALVCHEPRFHIIREDVFENEQRPPAEQSFSLLNVGVVRGILINQAARSLKVPGSPSIDGERVIDDFILLCFLCGNDFIPQTPSLSIRDGDIGHIILRSYFEAFPAMGGYITLGSTIHWGRLCVILNKIAELEKDRLAEKDQEDIKRKRKRISKIEALLNPLVPSTAPIIATQQNSITSTEDEASLMASSVSASVSKTQVEDGVPATSWEAVELKKASKRACGPRCL